MTSANPPLSFLRRLSCERQRGRTPHGRGGGVTATTGPTRHHPNHASWFTPRFAPLERKSEDKVKLLVLQQICLKDAHVGRPTADDDCRAFLGPLGVPTFLTEKTLNATTGSGGEHGGLG